MFIDPFGYMPFIRDILYVCVVVKTSDFLLMCSINQVMRDQLAPEESQEVRVPLGALEYRESRALQVTPERQDDQDSRVQPAGLDRVVCLDSRDRSDSVVTTELKAHQDRLELKVHVVGTVRWETRGTLESWASQDVKVIVDKQVSLVLRALLALPGHRVQLDLLVLRVLKGHAALVVILDRLDQMASKVPLDCRVIPGFQDLLVLLGVREK